MFLRFIFYVGLFHCHLINTALEAQVIPDYGVAFPQNEVTTVKIIIDVDSLQLMIDELDNIHDYPATFIFMSSTLNDTLQNVGLRLKGNTSLIAAKKSFKIAFDAFDTNLEWQNQNKMNLIAQQNDPSMLRNKMCHDMFRHFGIPSERTSYTRLYINEEYRGLYVNTEQIDKKFAKLHFDQEGDGNLYKCTYPADLNFINSNPTSYQFTTSWGTQPYELKTNNWANDYSDLAHFIDVLVNTSLGQLPCELPRVFNVEAYLKTAAIDILMGNWDGYIYNKNNFYLYHNQLTGQFNYMPYDMDNTFGIDWVGVDWGNRNIYNWASANESRPLFKRLMQIPAFRNRFSYHIQTICNEYFNEENLGSIALDWQNLIAEAAIEDTYRPLDFEFSVDDFLNAIDDTWGGQVNYGIAPYVSTRRNTALSQLENFTTQTSFSHWITHIRLPQQILIEGRIEGPQAAQCQLKYSLNGTDFTTVPFTDNAGILQVANDGIYSYLHPEWPAASDKFYYQTILSDGALTPCSPSFLWLTNSTPGLHINEVMSLNSNTIADEAGEFDDWVELYNGTNSGISLHNKFLSDDSTNWNKFPLPNVIIPPQGFLLIWLDDDPEQGTLHANFKISTDEVIILTSIEDGQPRTTDIMRNLPTTSDQSLALDVDGGDISHFTMLPTPGFSNNVTTVEKNTQSIVYAYPNPGNEMIYFSRKVDSVILMDATGRIVLNEKNLNRLNTAQIKNGIYFLQLDQNIVRQIIQH